MTTIRTDKLFTRALLMLALFVFAFATAYADDDSSRNPRIHLLGGSFDPKNGGPTLPAAAQFLPTQAKQTAARGRYLLVQFTGPVTDVFRAAVENSGAKLVQYMPDYAFIVQASEKEESALRQLSFVRFVGPYRPAWRVDPELLKRLNGAGAVPAQWSVVVHPGESIAAVLAAMKRVYPYMEVVKGGDDGARRVVIRVTAANALTLLQFILESDAVAWIEPWYEKTIQNNESIWVIQNGTRVAADVNTAEYPSSAPIWSHDILGTGQIVAIADSGLTDSDCFFTPGPTHQAVAAPAAITVDNTRRKVIAYNVMPGAADGDQNGTGTNPCGYHGSHVSGSVGGDSNVTLSTATTAGHNSGDGMAPQAKYVFQDIGTTDAAGDCSLAGIPNDLHDLFTQAYDAGARIHTNSWGGGNNGAYDTESQQVDDYMYNNEYLLTLFASANAGPAATTVGSPGTAKNTLTVGATNNGSAGANNIVYYSSRGPTVDGRIKPDISAPGDTIISENGDPTDASACATKTMSGTSMATPTTAGAAALVRQYFVDGWYPTGVATPANSFTPTSALMKAVMTVGARAMTGSQCTGTVTCGGTTVPASPNNHEGWGRVTLIDSLWFNAAPTSNVHLKLWDVPNCSGVTTGTTAEYTLQNVVAGTRLRINVAWNDAPGALGAAKELVNDLNLEVTDPNGLIYHGNQWVASPAAQAMAGSLSGAAGWDSTNNIEGVQIAAPVAGNYRVRIIGFNVPGYNSQFRQGYGIAATGNFTQTCGLTAPTGVAASVPAANQVSLSWNAVGTATKYAILRGVAGQTSCTSCMSQVGQTTGTTFTDTTVQGGFQYVYAIQAIAPCDGPVSSCVTATATGNCTLDPTFSGITSATNAGTASCGVNVAWSAATANCPLASGIKYNVYRSTTPSFTPAAGNRIATCVAGTTFPDSGMTSGQTYFYTVRAEDGTTGNGGPCNGGNEDTNNAVRSATPLGNATAVGTWTDSDVDTRNQLILAGPWSVVSTADSATYVQTGTYAYKTSAGTANYPDATCASARTPVLTLNGNTTVTFWERHSLEYQFDGVVVEYSTNGGSSWTKLNGNAMYGGSTFTNTGNACAYAATDSAFQSTAAAPQALTAYASRSFTVTASAGASFIVRWTLSSDSGANDVGFLLDNISITNANVPQPCVLCTTPGVPTGLVATSPSNNTIHLAWAAGSPAGVTYKLYRSTGACPAGAFSLLASGLGTLSYDDASLTGGAAYSYKVTAVDSTAGCESAQSSCASITTTGGPGLSSRGKTNWSRPQDTAGTPTKWIYSTGAATLTPPGIGSVYAVSNDRVLHGLPGGNTPSAALWAAAWSPWLANAPSQARPPVPGISIGGATKEVFLGAQDGNVYAINANSGSLMWKTASPLGDMVQAAVNGIFVAYGGSLNLLIAPTRNATAVNVVYGLNPATGSTSWLFNNGGGASGIGVIAGDPWLDYGSVNPSKNKVYFTSRKMTGGSSGTLWCLDYTASTATLCSEPGSSWPVNLGDIDSAPTLVGNRLYVGNNAGVVYCINALTGATIWSVNIGDGPIKGFVDPDWTAASLPYRLFAATSTKVTALMDNGASATTAWTLSMAGPSLPLFTGPNLYVGSTDGSLYELSNLAGPPASKSIVLGSGTYAVGSPSYDYSYGVLYVGTDAGKLYAVQVPLP